MGRRNVVLFAGGLKIEVIYHRKLPFGTKSSGLIIKGGLKIEGCKIEGLLYMYMACQRQEKFIPSGVKP